MAPAFRFVGRDGGLGGNYRTRRAAGGSARAASGGAGAGRVLRRERSATRRLPCRARAAALMFYEIP